MSPTSPVVEEAGEEGLSKEAALVLGPKASMKQYLNEYGGIINNDNSFEEALPGKFLAQNVSKKDHKAMMDKFEHRIELF